MDFELLAWQSAFIIYVWLHLGAKVRRFYAAWKRKSRSRKRTGQGWF